ncbi:MAG: phosphodiester glycosidase family protein [Chitinispirillales bacterium]|jgi:uncharacterized protein YigE (DUF2233 family)|nr:phosphodiester glycosidase family protein [Chitinispirillales bacterium]
MNVRKIIVPVAVFILVVSVGVPARWRQLDDGLEFGRFHSPHYSRADSGVVNVLRVDPKRYELRLLNASHPARGEPLTAREWGRRERMTAVINAAMYQTDYLTSVSHMRMSEHVNNPRLSRDKAVLVFEPLRKDIPPVRIVDLECDDFNTVKNLYGSAVQSIRMISCTGRNVWQENHRRWSIAAVAVDSAGRFLLIQCTAPHSVHEFINVLRGLSLSIDRAMYMEGGSPSQLYIVAPNDTLEFIGEFSSGGRSLSAPAVPNVIGVRRIVP